MAIEEGFFSASDGEQLFYRFQADSSRETPLILIHGHGEHSGRYLKFFDRLASLRLPIATFDLRGCGRSGGLPVYVSDFNEYLSDISSFLKFLEERHNIRGAVYLFGHSLGGLIATAWASKNNGRISKLILSSPLFGIPLAGTVKALVGLLDPLIPRWVVRNPVRVQLLTHDPGEAEKYLSDPLIRRSITVRLVHEMIKYGAFFIKQETEFPFPVYILMAEDDFIVNRNATLLFFQRLKSPEKKLEGFPGFFHEIFNERGQERAFERLRYYLTK